MNLKTAVAIVLTSLPSVAQAKEDPFAKLRLPQPAQPPALQPGESIALATSAPLPLEISKRSVVHDLESRIPRSPRISVPASRLNLQAEANTPIVGTTDASGSILKLNGADSDDKMELEEQSERQEKSPNETQQGMVVVENHNSAIQRVNAPLLGAAAAGIGAYFGWRAAEGVVSQIERDNPILNWGQCRTKAFIGKIGGQMGCQEPEALPEFPTRRDLSAYDWQLQGYFRCLDRENLQFKVRSQECDDQLEADRAKIKAEERGERLDGSKIP